MTKYIDAERLRKEVKETEKAAHKFALSCADSERRKFYEGKDFAYQYVGILIDFLQKEMPEMDIEKEIEDYWEAHGPMSHAEYDRLAKCARHFYELGRQAKPETFDTVAFQKGVQEGRRLERKDVKSIIQSRIDEILGDAQPAPILRMELQELIKKIEA